MAIDGRFSLQLELERFLERCPELKLIPCFDSLLKKGDKITEEAVVEAVAQLVLHPKYTIPLLGCFRAIGQKIVDRTVKLLNDMSNLSSDDDNSMEGLDDDGFLREDDCVNNAEIASVIYFCVGKGRSLYLHELACLAFCRALDFIPFLLGSILNYFKFAPAPFERIFRSESVTEALAKPHRLLRALRSSYCFLTLETEVFRTLWDWSFILDLVVLPRDCTPSSDPALKEVISDLRWCGIHILTVVLRLSPRASKNLGLVSEEDFQSSLRWRVFCMDLSLEKAGQYLESSLDQADGMAETETSLVSQHYKCSTLAGRSSLATEALQPNQFGLLVTENPEISFVLTPTMTKSFGMMSLAVSQRWPMLLYGPAGSGKTAVINKLAHSQGSSVLSIHMDEQIDGKTLIGSYVCSGKPGEFRWQPGSLALAVRRGFWVVFEDIDKAPPDIFSILLPLLEGADEFSTGHSETIRVNSNFRLFATVTSTSSDASPPTEGWHFFGAAWLKVMISAPSDEDLLDIVMDRYPELESLSGKLIKTFQKVNQKTSSLLGFTTSSKYHYRFSLRDLLKLCKRIANTRFSFGKGGLSSYTCECICKEAIDVFASFSTSAVNRLAIRREICNLWTVSALETLYPANKPNIMGQEQESSMLHVGRASLEKEFAENAFNRAKKPFVELHASVCALERIAISVKFNEPVLLVGETGTGKTTLVQTLASRLGRKLTVLNLSQQSDVADLLGGFKPVDARFVCFPLYQEFENLFTCTLPSKENGAFLDQLRKSLNAKNWNVLLSGFQKGIRKIIEIGRSGRKRKRPLSEDILKAWENFSTKLEGARAQVSATDGIVFSFVEGAFISAMKKGEWILLDEVNLAPPEILQRVTGVLEDEKGSLCLAERGDIDYVFRHPHFRMFACMNPATDAGKRDLPISLRGRFSEYYVDDVLDDEDLVLFVNQFMEEDPSYRGVVGNIVGFYKAAKETEEKLHDGANQKPHYSLRSLYRALEYLKKAKRHFKFENSLYDGFSMFFLNLLDDTSSKQMNNLICKHLLNAVAPETLPFYSYLINLINLINIPLKADDIWIWDGYVLTKSVREHLRNLAQAIFIGKYPVLLQGPTSSGKTSLVWFLAAITGHEFVRINNHEHTDLQEYLGSYVTDVGGKLVFQEGALVKAVRNGHWVVLDELNLAPSDVLEALNRLLDDNRELFVPELGETICCHPDFMLFATQNPPVVYGGRKLLSRAFRNRFVEIHVDDIPQEELITILEKRCKIPGSCAGRMVDVMKELQLHRQSSKIFAGKHGYITPRDLFRWAERFSTFGDKDFSYDGYYLMAERLRNDAEKRVVKDILERKLKVKFSYDDLYNGGSKGRYTDNCENVDKIIWTKGLWRTYFLVERCYRMREPVLLVGETGGGKTTVCQLLSNILGSKLHTLNCHQYTETSDFLGGFYPVRERSKISTDFQNHSDKLVHAKAFIHFPGDVNVSMDINQASLTLDTLSLVIKSYRDGSVFHPEVTEDEVVYIENIYLSLSQLQKKWRTIFMWQDGPLVKAMKDGDLFLVDEISLADDSVLERLNSVLEPERKLSLAEKGGPDLENIVAHPDFFLLATMNPGGDYGKKELSPALRNRFTEIWVPSVSDKDDLKSIALQRISKPNAFLVDVMLDFWEWFNLQQTGKILTVRDLLSWVSFINAMDGKLSSESAFIHGAFLVLLDGLILGTNISKGDAEELRVKCFSFLLQKLKANKPTFHLSTIQGLESFFSFEGLESYGWADIGCLPVTSNFDNMEWKDLVNIPPFCIEKGTDWRATEGFDFQAPTTCRNALRVLRALQLNRPVLLEGSPGVGKTSLITALGKFSGHTVVRINLSEQTDIMDLLGSDLPVGSDEGIQFAWSDGILLQALKKGSWILLDELNLAPQSVLEGLNSILDHRAEIFIPELGNSIKCPTSFRVFACQNPSCQGGGRKGLPKSFLNRFIKVYVDELVGEDYESICYSLFPSIERSLLSNLIKFNKRLHHETMLDHRFGQDGSPWEFNLRDVIRSCQIIQDASEGSKSACFLSPIYLQRMRTSADRLEVLRLYEQTFGVKPYVNPHPKVKINPDTLTVGDISIDRYYYHSSSEPSNKLMVLPGLRHCLEAAAQCVKNKWLCILVGPPSSGKTSLIRLLAQLTGNALNELNLSSATDISELLGCFEQYNASRHYRLAIAQVERYMNEYCNLRLEHSLDTFNEKKDLTARWISLLSNLSSSTTFIENPVMKNSIRQLLDILECVILDIDEHPWPLSWSAKDLRTTLDVIRKLENDCQRRHNSVKFEWVTGPLIKAIENGEWIVLENANLCNATVLDRINSLVEQSGSITVSECGTVEGDPVILHPHPRFQMFLTVNPSFGEVSRAMRNRGVEIYMMHPYWLDCETDGQNHYELREVKRFIALSGLPMSKLVDMMAKAHIYAKREGFHLNISVTYLELSRWVQLFQQLVMKGNKPGWSLVISWELAYLSSFVKENGLDIVSHAALSYLSSPELYKFISFQDSLLSLPGGWPSPLKLKDYVFHSKEASVRHNVMYLESLGSQVAAHKLLGTLNKGLMIKNYPDRSSGMIHSLNAVLLHRLMFPKFSKVMAVHTCFQNVLEQVLAEKKLCFAADWVIEQATEDDYSLYIHWFEWFGARLEPFFSWFSNLLKELRHRMWTRVFQLRNELMSPSVSQLRCSLQQWSREDEHNHDYQDFRPVLGAFGALRSLEEELFNLLLESRSFDMTFKLYTNLLEHHIIFWDSIISRQNECRQIYWHSLMKDARKLLKICPKEAAQFQDEMKKLVVTLDINLSKSSLWACGGHPILPLSSAVYQLQCQISNLCESMWPSANKIVRQGANGENEVIQDRAFFAHRELRCVAMHGLCMSSYVIGKANGSESEIIQQLEQIYQGLFERVEFEKKKLEINLVAESEANLDAPFKEQPTDCCDINNDILSKRSGFNCWLMTQPILDEASLALDLELLQHLTEIGLVDNEEQYQALLNLSDRVKSSLNFALESSSRPLADILPHQMLLWTVDAPETVPGANRPVSSFIMRMWFRWHATLWKSCPMLSERLGEDDYGILFPHKLFWPLKLSTVDHILENVAPVIDYHLQGFKLRAASRNIWLCLPYNTNSDHMLLCVARSLFQQIIYAHKKSFKDSEYAKIRSAFHSFEEFKNPEKIKSVVSLLESSSHNVFTPLIETYIKPLVRELYTMFSDDGTQRIGCALLHIGGLRYTLLVHPCNLDPSSKYSIKYSKLTEKIASLECEIEVREECIYLSGTAHQTEGENNRKALLKELNAERRRLEKKIVFRPNPEEHKVLKQLCDEFLKEVNFLVEWIKGDKNIVKDLVAEAHNQQGIMSSFIDRLTNVYSAFGDITEPIQVAIYEIKLGLSLFVSGALYKGNPEISKNDFGLFRTSVYELMRFPRVCAFKLVHLSVAKQHNLSTHHIKLTMSGEGIGMGAFRNLIRLAKVTLPTGVPISHPVASELSFKVSIYHIILQRIKDSVVVARFLGDDSLKILHETFDEVVSLWTKHRVTASEAAKGEQFQFRTRAFKMANVINIDVSNCANLLGSDSFAEWQDLLSEDLDEKMMISNGGEAMEQGWDAEESDLDGIIDIHNQLFGSVDLVQRRNSDWLNNLNFYNLLFLTTDMKSTDQLGSVKVSDMDRISSFLASYTLGMKMTKGMRGSFSSCFDAKLAPEHLLRLCLEHDYKFVQSHRPTNASNFFKESNPALMTKLVEPVANLKGQILILPEKFENHPAIGKILEVIDMILALPLDSPLAKALSALEFLLNRVWIFPEFPVSEQLQPILALVASWQKLELESWPALLDQVDSQFERDAGKLWFPLYSVLLQSDAADVDKYRRSRIKSLDELFATSSIGEFKKQLQLLLSFHGQIASDLNRRIERRCQEENLTILYNTFGFYVQFLPRILRHIGEKRKGIEKDLNDLLKLCRWTQMGDRLAIENFKRTRVKLRKMVKIYSDILQQPLMEFLDQETSRSGKTPSTQVQNLLVDGVSKEHLDAIRNQIQSKDEECPIWLAEWWKNLESMEELMSDIRNITPSKSPYLLYWEERELVQELCSSLIHCCEVREDKRKNNFQKKKAFSSLLKLLDDDCGLSKHRMVLEGQFDKSQSWILQPSYEVQHLLLTHGDYSSGNNDLNHLQSSSVDSLWKTGNKCYFRSIVSIRFLEKICHKFHEDFEKKEVERSYSYVDHLIEIQQEQRDTAYKLSKQLKFLRQCIWPVSNPFSTSMPRELNDECFLVRNQLPIFRCLWQQKQIFDGLCTLLYEEHLLLQTVENNHMNSCSAVKGGVGNVCLFIGGLLTDFQKEKNTLDQLLLGCNGDFFVVEPTFHPYSVNKQMEQLVVENFERIEKLEPELEFQLQENGQAAVKSILLGHLKDMLGQTRLSKELFYSSQKGSLLNACSSYGKNVKQLEASFRDSLGATFNRIRDILQSIGNPDHNLTRGDDSKKKIFEKDIEHLQLDPICQDIKRTFQYAGELLEQNAALSSSISIQLRNMSILVEKVLAFGDNLLQDFLMIHSMVSEVTCALANILSSLFTQGFGSTENMETDNEKEVTKDASGTGMGEGTGMNDVSDQINDEDQLLGTSEKSNEGRDASSDLSSKTETGIEMEEDFDAEAGSVSEDSEDEESEDRESEQLDSAMGKVGDNRNVVDQKVGDNGEDDENPSTNEKYEHGPSVKDQGSMEDELRAKEESTADKADGENLDARQSDYQNDENGNEGNDAGADDMSIDKDEASIDPSDINPLDQNQKPDEDTLMDEMPSNEPPEDGESEDLADAREEKIDELLQGADSENYVDNTEAANADETCAENEMETEDNPMQKHDPVQLSSDDHMAQSGGWPAQDHSDAADLGEPDESSTNNLENNLAPSLGKPNSSEMEISIADSRDGEKLNMERSRSSRVPSQSLDKKLQPNPLRSIGEALEGWKERVKVSCDLQDKKDTSDDLVDDNADEYGYTADFQEGTAQALGPATVDQIKGDVCQSEIDKDKGDTTQKDTKEVDITKSNFEKLPIMNTGPRTVQDVTNPQEVDVKKELEESMDVDGDHSQDNSSFSDSLVTVRRLSEDMNQFFQSPMNDDELGKAHRFEPSATMNNEAAALWRRYELETTRLSHELVEQLRLVMEPTLASKLQGDYKTGKRINMKKVIPYIASHYRKDKIWLRRTRPSKRDYQVVIAVDDSRSMSEGKCGNFALEALVTVCRAMSQLDVGSLAVTSFGQQGNIRLLHNFDQAFTPEAGVEMISSFTFKQENTVADEPMVDLLKNLNDMLDSSVSRARLPSGYNPLQQLVLIIADGRCNEKEKLKRYVRDMLSKKRMVAFLILDSPNESILDVKEATLQGKNFKLSRYIDSFPFPYYIVLKDINALPRTLADLLRQWFELMQHSRE